MKTRMYARMRLHAICLTLLLFCRISAAQVASARLEGLVQDPSGAVVHGAKISATNTRTQASIETLTTSDGFFVFPSLQPGHYTLSVEAVGFKTSLVPDIELNVGTTVAQHIRLQVGEITETVTARAGEGRIQAARGIPAWSNAPGFLPDMESRAESPPYTVWPGLSALI